MNLAHAKHEARPRTYVRPAASSETPSGIRVQYLTDLAPSNIKAAREVVVPAVGDDIFLECSWHGEPGVLLIRAVQFICSVRAELAFAADGDYPFDTRTIANFPDIFDVATCRRNCSRSLVAGNAPGGILPSSRCTISIWIADWRYKTQRTS